MPKLARLRFVSIGHPNARMQDLLLNFNDQANLPSDSTIWLRNGGGKSSILSLFFALTRPNRRDFLGSRADAKQRRIEDYILSNDRSVVASEWMLDLQGAKLDLETVENPRFLTGVFYEYASNNRNMLRRLFYCVRVNEAVPETTIEGLPIDTTNAEGETVRRTYMSFRQRWNELRDLHPSLQFYCTENQSEWSERLTAAGLDPGLFGYQLIMNSREGGADELFRFNSPDDFVDFLLELTVEASKSEGISENLGVFRKQLQQRKHELLPDLELSSGLIERLTPLAQIHQKRLWAVDEAQKLAKFYTQIERSIEKNSQNFDQMHQNIETEIRGQRTEFFELEKRAHRDRALASVVALRLIDAEVAESKARVEELKDTSAKAKRELVLWNAAYPYRNYIIAKQDAEGYREQVSGKNSTQGPLLQKLQDIAQEYVSALKHQAQSLRARQNEHKHLYDARDEESRDIDKRAAELERLASGLEAEASSYQKNIDNRDRQYEKLHSLNIIAREELPEDAIVRFETQLKELSAKHKATLRAKESNVSLEEELSLRIQELQRLAAERKANLASYKRDYDAGIGAREKLENDKNLLRCLELDSLSMDDLSEDAATQLQRRSVEMQERIARLRTESAALERARVHLQEHGLMPPSIEVESMLGFLNTQLQAKSGWAYIHENVDASTAEKRELVQKHPELAQGIVIAAKEFEHVKQLFKISPERLPATPITISCEEAFRHPKQRGQELGFVIGPKDDACFDVASANQALQNIEEGIDKLEKEIRAAQQAQTAYAESALMLKQFRTLYPQAWFASQHAKIMQLKLAFEDDSIKLELVLEEKQRIAKKKRQDDDEDSRLRSDLQNLAITLDKLRSFTEEIDKSTEQWAQLCEEKNAKSQAYKDEAEVLHAQSSDIRDEARRLLKAADPFAEEARVFETEMARVKYLDNKKNPSPKQGNIEELKKNYSRLLEQFEHELGNDELLRAIETAENQASKEKRDLERIIKNIISFDDVKEAITGLENPNDIEIKHQNADAWLQTLSEQEKQAIASLSTNETLRQQRHKIWLGEGKPELVDGDNDISQTRIERHEKAAQHAQEELERIEKRIRELERKISDSKHAKDALNKDLERLESVYRSHQAFLSAQANAQAAKVESSTNDPSAQDNLEASDIGKAITALEQRLDAHRQIHDELDQSRRQAVAQIRRWVDDTKFAALQNRIVTQFKTLAPEILEVSAQEYRDALTIRIREISATLTEIEKHRTILAKFLLNAADDGLRLLKLADAASIVPIQVPDIGGSRFLRISMKEPPSQSDKLERIQELVDSLVDETVLPTGVKLIQRAVRQIARPFNVRVLNPDPASPQRLIEITETARFSGGEQLTCAILLYCTLANVRARTRGMNRQPTSVLILDNPIGRASRTVFIDMQRQFASAMGIQLIYTTAVNDLEALSILPNVVRLRNERIDRNRGHRLLEEDVAISGKLESIRISKLEHNPQTEAPQGG